MEPSEIAQHLPEWVIPEGTDLTQLRNATEQLMAEFSRPIFLVRQAPSMSSSWSYTSEGGIDHTQWHHSGQKVPQVCICSTSDKLKNRSDIVTVLRATSPYGSWVVEDSLHQLYSWGELARLSVETRRAIRLEWLNKLKEKLDER